VTDDLGRSIGFDSPPKRIISLAPSITEALFFLGKESSILGVTTVCDYPRAVSKKTRVGDLQAPDIERIIQLDPDLVLLSVEGNTQGTFNTLERLGLKLFVTNPRTLEGVLKSLTDMRRIFGKNDSLASAGAELKNTLDNFRRSAAGKKTRSVLFVISVEPLIVAGRGTFLDEMIRTVGGCNIGANAVGSYPVFSREEVVRANPEYLLYPNDLGVDLDQLVRRFPEWEKNRAVRNGNVYSVDPDIFLRPGPRVFDGLACLDSLLRRSN